MMFLESSITLHEWFHDLESHCISLIDVYGGNLASRNVTANALAYYIMVKCSEPVTKILLQKQVWKSCQLVRMDKVQT